MLGCGAFGVVHKSEVSGLNENGESTITAVKMVRSNIDPVYIKSLITELKIMIHVGKHMNVVNLLGAYTKNIIKGQLS